MLYSKNEATVFNHHVDNIDEFKFGNTEADGTYEILGNTTITVPWLHLSNFRRSLEMLLINSKVELKLRWTLHCVLLVLGAANSVALWVLF